MIKAPLLVVITAVALCACTGEPGSRSADAAPVASSATQVSVAPGLVVDSALPMPEALRHFQAGIEEPAPTRLEKGATTLDELLRQLVAAYATRDADALDRLALTRAEFAFLYYPDSPYPELPYELAPDFLWYLIEQRGMRAVGRATEVLAGKGSEYLGYHCPGAVKEEGDTRLWGPCFATVRFADGLQQDLRVANAIAERDGRFKLVGFDNGL